MDLDDFFIQETETPHVPARAQVYESDEVTHARTLDRQGRTIEVIITVKTAPQPSEKYEDTVCVAGIALNPIRWVRLYPIPFRHLSGDRQFNKYAHISVTVRRSENDPRIESLKVNPQSIEIIRNLSSSKGWVERANFVEQLPSTTVCNLRKTLESDLNGPSLGFVTPEPGSFHLTVEPHPGWTEKQAAVIQRNAAQLDLEFDIAGRQHQVPILKAPRLLVRTQFTCAEHPDCKGHSLQLLDWEATALQHHHTDWTTAALSDFLVDRFETNPTAPGKALRIYVGNQAQATRRRNFEALGLYYPTEEAVENSLTLF